MLPARISHGIDFTFVANARMRTIRSLLTPKTSKFYRLFDEVAHTLSEMSEVFLLAIAENDDTIFKSYVVKLEDLEHQNDHTTHRLFVELGRNFITPFDREDIHSLATALDDIADLIWKICKQMSTYSILGNDKAIIGIADIHHGFMLQLAKTVNELKNKRGLPRLGAGCVGMYNTIAQCDNMLDAAISGLFLQNIDIYLAIKKMDQYEFVQTLLDKSNDAVNTIESVIIKYS